MPDEIVWKTGCKKCGKEFTYGDRSYKIDLEKGFSRPEYCEECQKEQIKMRSNMSTPYFSVKPIKGIEPSGLGTLSHPGMEHIPTIAKDEYDATLYGITPEKITELANWFSDPLHRVAIVIGPTGSGKSTALPYYMMNPPPETGIAKDYFTRDGQIIHTQPRTMSAKGQTDYVAKKIMNSKVGKGHSAGFAYSKHHQTDRRNLWVSVTDGTFINFIKQGKLGSYGYAIIDEAHERSINIDDILILLKKNLSLYPKLKVIIASATIDSEKFRDYFGSKVTTVIELEGKSRVDKDGNPVSYKRFFRDPDCSLPYEDLSILSKSVVKTAAREAVSLAKDILEGKINKGDILVFFQGVEPISSAIKEASKFIEDDDSLMNIVELYPLYRDLPEEEKNVITSHNLDDGKIWIIFSTNIAEASITIDSLGYEIETGIENQSIFDPKTNTTSIPLAIISKANAKQRWGRTGRTRNGVVYCLYTETQFQSLFPDYPIPAIRRSSLEDSVLLLKSVGISDPSKDWLENPDKEEVDRSLAALVKSGALNEDTSLSQRGELLSSFSYPAEIIDAFFIADSLGIIIEFASLIPIIKNGGIKNILQWKYNWDAYTKFDAYTRQSALISGCHDDVEFLLKIVKSWTDLSWVDPVYFNSNTKISKKNIRDEWATKNFINTQAIENIVEERNSILEQFFDSDKEGEIREIDIQLIPRVRLLLSKLFPEVNILDGHIPYRYEAQTNMNDGTTLSCNCLGSTIDSSRIDDWTENIPMCESTDSEPLDRIFIDQIFPIGSRFSAINNIEKVGELKIIGNIVPPSFYVKEDNFAQEESDDESLDDDESPTVSYQDIIHNVPINYRLIHCPIHSHQDFSQAFDESVECEVVDYRFDPRPIVIVKPIVKPEPFEKFSLLGKKKGEDISVITSRIITYPNDNYSTLLVVEPNSGMEILMESEEITFSKTSAVISCIPIGSQLRTKIEEIVPNVRRVRLSLLNQNEEKLNSCLKKTTSKYLTVSSTVVDIRQDKVLFLLGWAIPSEGFIPIASINSNKISNLISELSLGQEVKLSIFTTNNKTYKMSLTSPPKAFKNRHKNNQLPPGIAYHNPNIEVQGKMSGLTYSNLRGMGSNQDYLDKIDRLYWLSNCISVSRVFDSNWADKAKSKYGIGSTAIAKVLVIKDPGLILLVDDQYKGFLPRRYVIGQFNSTVAVGDMIHVRIEQIKNETEEFIFSQIDSPKITISNPAPKPVVESKTKPQSKPVSPVPSPKPSQSPVTPQNKSPVQSIPKSVPSAPPKKPQTPTNSKIAPERKKGFWEKFSDWLNG